MTDKTPIGEPAWVKTSSYSALCQLISPDIKPYLRGAARKAWPYIPFHPPIPNPEQNLRLPIKNLRILLAEKIPHSGHEFGQYDLLRWCPHLAIKETRYQAAMNIIFVIDRYAYWLHNDDSEELLEILQKIVDQRVEVAVPPQIMVRKARVLRDQGALQADQVLTDLLNQCTRVISGHPRPGDWPYNNQCLLVVTIILQLKGQIMPSLGLSMDAAQLFVGALQIANSLQDNN